MDTAVNLKDMLQELQSEAVKDSSNAEAIQLVLSYAQDIVEAWPTMTLRTLWKMTTKVEALKQALELLK